MPKLSGLELLRQLQFKPMTILCTAYSEYALESYDLDVVDYLLKPIGLARFTKSISKVLEKKRPAETITKSAVDNSFFVKSEYKKVKIDPDEVLYIEAMEKYVRIYLRDKKDILSLMSMTAILKLLDNSTFLRIHRSFIINKNAIDSIESSCVVIQSKRIPYSKANKQMINELYSKQ